MRTIKFRGYNRKNKEWIYGFYLQNRGAHFVCPDEFANGKSWDDYDVVPDTVWQYTGLKDKSGREIYEGDLVDTFIGELKVVWSNYDGEAGFHLQDDGGTLYSIRGMKMTVKGNIHDNPELVK